MCIININNVAFMLYNLLECCATSITLHLDRMHSWSCTCGRWACRMWHNSKLWVWSCLDSCVCWVPVPRDEHIPFAIWRMHHHLLGCCILVGVVCGWGAGEWMYVIMGAISQLWYMEYVWSVAQGHVRSVRSIANLWLSLGLGIHLVTWMQVVTSEKFYRF